MEELQKGFFSCMDRSEPYVISNPNSYEGYMVSIEFGYATYSILHTASELRKIYFTNIPLGYDKFALNPNLSFNTFLRNLYHDPAFQNELAFYKRIKDKRDKIFTYSSERDFYDDLRDMYGKVLLLKERNNLVIGLDSLLDRDIRLEQDDEYEL